MKKIIITIIVIVVVFILYYLISPIFNVQEVNDAAPTEIETPIEKEIAETEGLLGSGFEKLSKKDKIEMMKQVSLANELIEDSMNDEMKMSVENISVSESVAVQGTVGHPASGVVRVFSGEEGEIVRFEDFKTINGPKLNVYLSKDLDAKEFIDLGPIRGTTGNINYDVPEGTDLSEYKYVMHWCVTFGVLFNYAKLP